MKKILGIFFISCLLFTGCEKQEEQKQQEQINLQEVVNNYIKTMKETRNYTVEIKREGILDYTDVVYPNSSFLVYQVDRDNAKVFDVNRLAYYDTKTKKIYSTQDADLDSLLIPQEYSENRFNEKLFTFTFLDIPYTVEKIEENKYHLNFQDDKKFMEFLSDLNISLNMDVEKIEKKEVILEGTGKYIDTLTVSYETNGKNHENKEFTRDETIELHYMNFKVTQTPSEVNIIYNEIKPFLNKKINSSFTKTFNDKEHIIDVEYHFELFGGVVAVAEISIDGQKLKDYKYMYSIDKATTLDELIDLKEVDLNTEFRKNNFYIIQGSQEQYLAIYSNLLTEIGERSKLYVFNDKGKNMITLEDKIGMSIEPLTYYDEHGYTKVNEDSITFYAYRRQDQTPNPDASITISEYKLTFEEKLKFEKINTYENICPSGDGQLFNDIIK